MLTQFKAKHTVSEIDGVRCTVVEAAASESRVNFLRKLLEVNGFTVKIQQDNKEGEPATFTIGVTNLFFNPVISVYERNLKTEDKQVVSPAYWFQETTVCDPRYWVVKKRKIV